MWAFSTAKGVAKQLTAVCKDPIARAVSVEVLLGQADLAISQMASGHIRLGPVIIQEAEGKDGYPLRWRLVRTRVRAFRLLWCVCPSGQAHIAARSVVTRDIPEGVFAVGRLCRVIQWITK